MIGEIEDGKPPYSKKNLLWIYLESMHIFVLYLGYYHEKVPQIHQEFLFFIQPVFYHLDGFH
jgi:hypothetical protein